MPDNEQTSHTGHGTSTKSTTWQPSARDLSRPTYSGSFTGQEVAQGARPARPRRTIPPAAFGVALMVTCLVGFWMWMQRTAAPAPVLPEPVAVLEVFTGAIDISTGGAAPVPVEVVAGLALEAGTVITTAAYQPAMLSGPSPQLAASTAAGDAALAAEPADIQDAVAGTPDPLSRAAFRLASGASIRLDAGSRARIESQSIIALEQGAIYVDSQFGSRSSVEVRTTLGVVRDIGTQFEVRLMDQASDSGMSPALRVSVREGTVILNPEGGSHHEARAGVELALHTDGRVTSGTVPLHGPRWRWVLDTAPIPEVEGRPLRAFLDWLMREGGWHLAFSDQRTADVASTTLMHGDITGLTADQATTMVLEGSGLTHAVEGDTFRVSTRDEVER